MGEFDVGARWDENPFVFFGDGELMDAGLSELAPENPVKAIYENLAPLIIRSPPAKRYPQEPSGVAGFNILTDPLSALMPTSAVPDPIIGITTQRKMRPTVQGKEGMATHLNILVDVSGSMYGPEAYKGAQCYGYTKDGYGLGGEDVAMIVVAMMIGQAGLSNDSFSLFAYNTSASVVWDGPSQDYKGCLDYILADYGPTDNNRPFSPGGGNQMSAGLTLIGETMGQYDFDQSVTVVITDGTFTDDRWAANQCLNDDYTYSDEYIRKMGPLFYVVIGSGLDESNMSDDPDSKSNCDQTVEAFQNVLREKYGRSMDGCVLGFNILVGDDGNFTDFAGSLVDMARVNSGDSNIAPCPRL